MYTTSRYASEETRGLARELARLQGRAYAARGKKTIAALAKEARRLGESEILILEERGKKAAIIATLAVDELGRWLWRGEKPFNPSEKDNRRETEGIG